MKSTTTVSRSEVVAAAQRAIDAAAMEIVGQISPELVEDLMEVARTATTLSVAWYEGDCGCLVGTYRMQRGLPMIPSAWSEQFAIGMQFPEALLGAEWGKFDLIQIEDDNDEKGAQGMDIGKEERTIIVTPAVSPVPKEQPARPAVPAEPAPRRTPTPVDPTKVPEKVPAR